MDELLRTRQLVVSLLVISKSPCAPRLQSWLVKNAGRFKKTTKRTKRGRGERIGEIEKEYRGGYAMKMISVATVLGGIGGIA